mmetsp:Transcript_22094/g.45739  ORF Transcript_22094/g.45739 Transcript_22094/m.45739 type:complete len:143 (+) Transcript_22094:1036-1464(+)
MHPISLLLLCLQTVRLSAFIADQQQRPLLHAPVGITGSSHIPALRAKNGNKKADDDDGKGGGYKFGDISRGLASRFTKRVEQVTGKECKLASTCMLRCGSGHWMFYNQRGMDYVCTSISTSSTALPHKALRTSPFRIITHAM